ncbi:MAG: sulfatase [Ilumatobacteraceae bacterium]
MRRPNVVLINCDDLGYGDLGCYGSQLNATPALDRLAAEGLRLDSFYMASPVCSPSRAALLTGCYPPRIGFGDFDGLPVLFPGQALGLPPSEISLGRLLSNAGYRTAMIGKWHCGDQPQFLPTNHGFDSYLGLPYSNDMGRQVGTRTTESGDQRGYPPLPLLLDDEVLEQQPDQASLTARYLGEAVRVIRAADERPFFLYLAHMYVHLPIYVQERFAKASRNGAYGAAVETIDWVTAAILRELRDRGLDEDTLVVFTSDNGSRGRDGGSNAPLRGTKGTTWEGGMRVPFIARWPGRIEPGRTSDALTTSLDLFPTLAAICGATVPNDRIIDGIDISPLLLDGASSPREVFWFYRMNDLEAVRSGRWKLHLAKDGTPVAELYDVLADPAESGNLLSAHPEIVARLTEVADAARRTLGDARLGVTGTERRPAGRVDHPVALTVYDPTHPYSAAEYDLADRG